MYDVTRAFSLLKQISFERLGGSKEELEVANILMNEIKNEGYEAHLEEFEVDHSEVLLSELKVISPFEEIIPSTGVKMTGSTSKDGVEGDLIYVEDCEPANLIDIEGKIILINGRMFHRFYKEIVSKKPAGFISFSGSVYDDFNQSDLDVFSIREKDYEMGKIPGVNIRALDAQELIRKNPSRIRLTVIQNESKVLSRNVVTEIRGTTYPNQVIAVTAHYDSVAFSSGAYDNASGSVGIMEIFHYFVKNPPKRTLKFIWCGSEEMGLLGSKAYVKTHEEEMKDYVYNLNIDMIGVILGKEIAVSTAETSLVDYLTYFGKEIGIALFSRQGVYSSDSTPFADVGIPSTSFARISPNGGAQIHSRKDVCKHMSEDAFASSLKIVIPFLERIANSVVFPIPRNIPENMKLELDYYNLRKDRPKQ